MDDERDMSFLRETIVPLGRHVLQRRFATARTGGRALGGNVLARRSPKRLAASTRLLPRRLVARAAQAVELLAPEPPVTARAPAYETPFGLSAGAAAWLFDDASLAETGFEPMVPGLEHADSPFPTRNGGAAGNPQRPGPGAVRGATSGASAPLQRARGMARRGRIVEGDAGSAPQPQTSSKPSPPGVHGEPEVATETPATGEPRAPVDPSDVPSSPTPGRRRVSRRLQRDNDSPQTARPAPARYEPAPASAGQPVPRARLSRRRKADSDPGPGPTRASAAPVSAETPATAGGERGATAPPTDFSHVAGSADRGDAVPYDAPEITPPADAPGHAPSADAPDNALNTDASSVTSPPKPPDRHLRRSQKTGQPAPAIASPPEDPAAGADAGHAASPPASSAALRTPETPTNDPLPMDRPAPTPGEGPRDIAPSRPLARVAQRAAGADHARQSFAGEPTGSGTDRHPLPASPTVDPAVAPVTGQSAAPPPQSEAVTPSAAQSAGDDDAPTASAAESSSRRLSRSGRATPAKARRSPASRSDGPGTGTDSDAERAARPAPPRRDEGARATVTTAGDSGRAMADDGGPTRPLARLARRPADDGRAQEPRADESDAGNADDRPLPVSPHGEAAGAAAAEPSSSPDPQSETAGSRAAPAHQGEEDGPPRPLARLEQRPARTAHRHASSAEESSNSSADRREPPVPPAGDVASTARAEPSTNPDPLSDVVGSGAAPAQEKDDGPSRPLARRERRSPGRGQRQEPLADEPRAASAGRRLSLLSPSGGVARSAAAEPSAKLDRRSGGPSPEGEGPPRPLARRTQRAATADDLTTPPSVNVPEPEAPGAKAARWRRTEQARESSQQPAHEGAAPQESSVPQAGAGAGGDPDIAQHRPLARVEGIGPDSASRPDAVRPRAIAAPRTSRVAGDPEAAVPRATPGRAVQRAVRQAAAAARQEGKGPAAPQPATPALRLVQRPPAPIDAPGSHAATPDDEQAGADRPTAMPLGSTEAPGTSGRDLARATAGSLTRGLNGLSTVAFPPPSAPYTSTIARVPAAASAPPPLPASAPAHPAGPGAASAHPPTFGEAANAEEFPRRRRTRSATELDVERLYEQMLERLRRDLVVERERAGDLVRDPGWGI